MIQHERRRTQNLPAITDTYRNIRARDGLINYQRLVANMVSVMWFLTGFGLGIIVGAALLALISMSLVHERIAHQHDQNS